MCDVEAQRSYKLMWGAVGQWLEHATGDREVTGTNHSDADSKLWQVRLTHIACVFRMRRSAISRWSLLSGVYARGSKISHTRINV